MAFWQTNTGFQAWNNMFSTWFNSSFSWGLVGIPTSVNNTQVKTQKKDDDTYNPRYPWLNEEQYKKLEKMVSDKWLTWKEARDIMDQLYKVVLPKVQNWKKLDERQQELNNSIYQNSQNFIDWNKEMTMWTDLTTLAQEAKKKYNIPYNKDDNELIKEIIEGTPNGNRLAYEYTQNWNPEIFYAAWIWDKPQRQWWVKGMVNPPDKSILPDAWELINPVWYATETLDNAANKFADKIMVSWEWAAENLMNRITNMSNEEVERYRNKYKQMLKDKDIRVAKVSWDTIVEQLWNWIKWNTNYDYNEDEFRDWLIWQKATLWEHLIWAEDILRWETNPNVIQFFGNIPSSAIRTFTATVRGMTNPWDTLAWLYKLAATKEGHQAILQRYGSWDAFAKAMNTDPVWVADDAVAISQIIAWGVKWVWKMTWNEGLVKAVDNLNIWSATDALAQKTVWQIYGWMDKLAWMTDNKLVQWLNRYSQDVSSLQKLKENAGKDWEAIKESSVGQAVENWKDEMVDKIVWINEKDRDFIRENKDLVNDYLDWKKSTETVLDDVKEKVSEKRMENSEMWKEYWNLRKNKSKVVNTQNVTSDMKKKLKDQWITIDKKWNLKFSDMSKFNSKQKAAIIDAWDELKLIEKKKNINAWNVLDMRQKFDDKLNWDGKAMDLNWNLSAVDKATEWIIKDMRWVIDERAKTSVPWLAELDAKYSDAVAQMQQIRKDWLNPDWTFKDNARSKLRNLTKAWNEEKLARLEKLMPWITQDLKALDVWLTVERVTNPTVWLYSKWQRIGWWLMGAWMMWSTLAMLTGLWLSILSTPKNFVKVLGLYPDIAAKLQAWQKLLPSDVTKLQSLATRLQDWMEE